MLDLERTKTLVRFELMIDYYTYQSNFSCVSILRIALFSRTCFKPCQDYIETCTDVKMIDKGQICIEFNPIYLVFCVVYHPFWTF